MFDRALPCQARTLPLREKKARECGNRPTKKLHDRWLCSRHRRIVTEAAQAAAEKEANHG